MVSKIFVVLHCIALCSGAYYDPPAPVCPKKVEITEVDIEVSIPQFKVVSEGPFTDLDCHIQPEIITREFVATKVVISTTTSTLPKQIFTKAVIEKSPKVITITEVETATKVLENTDVNIVTVTATNYHTDFLTKLRTETDYVKTLRTVPVHTVDSTTATHVESSTFYITESPVITTEVTSYVPYTQAVYATHHRKADVVTHTSTETRTKTVCPQALHY